MAPHSALRAAAIFAALQLSSSFTLTAHPPHSPTHISPKLRVSLPTPLMAAALAGQGDFAPSPDIIPLPECPKSNRVSRTILGIYFAIACFGSALIVYPPLIVITLVSLFVDNTRRRWCDWIVQAWARLTLTALFATVKVEGIENLPPYDEAVLYAPNHCSFLDIFALSGYLPRRFKCAAATMYRAPTLRLSTSSPSDTFQRLRFCGFL